MGKQIAKTDIKRKQGFLYYVKEDSSGNLGIFEAEMSRGKKKSKK
jgi:hypothetical protein